MQIRWGCVACPSPGSDCGMVCHRSSAFTLAPHSSIRKRATRLREYEWRPAPSRRGGHCGCSPRLVDVHTKAGETGGGAARRDPAAPRGGAGPQRRRRPRGLAPCSRPPVPLDVGGDCNWGYTKDDL